MVGRLYAISLALQVAAVVAWYLVVGHRNRNREEAPRGPHPVPKRGLNG